METIKYKEGGETSLSLCEICKREFNIILSFNLCDDCRRTLELKKEWRKELKEVLFDLHFRYCPLFPKGKKEEGLQTQCSKDRFEIVESFISSLLAKQQEAPMGVSEWMRIGKLHGYHDYWKDMTRIALQEELVKIVESYKEKWFDKSYQYILDDLLADIKSKLK